MSAGLEINPVLPILIGVTALGGLLPCRTLRGAWVVFGIAGVLLLGPALLIPDGVPSSAASAGSMAPWRGLLRPAEGNPNLVDVTFQAQPWLIHLQREIQQLRIPFWHPHGFSGAPFLANGNAAPFAPFHLLFAALPLQAGLVILPWLRLFVAGLGTFLLARNLGVGTRASILAGLMFPLSGFFTSFLLYSMGNALALVPWILLFCERIASEKTGTAALAALIGAQLLGGHPETVVHTLLLASLYLLVRTGARGAWRAQFKLFAATILGTAAAAVAILPLLGMLTQSPRWLAETSATRLPLSLLFEQMTRIVLPDQFGNPSDGTWWGPFNYNATAVYAGALALPLAAAGTAGVWRNRRWIGVLLMLLFCFWGGYMLPGLREVLHSIPVLQRVLHHRLLFGLELMLAVLAARGLDAWLHGHGRRHLLAGVALATTLLGAAWIRFGSDFAEQGLTGHELGWTAWVLAACAAMSLSTLLPLSSRRLLYPLLIAAVLVDLLAAHQRTNPALSRTDLYPETGGVRFLQGRPERVAATGNTLRPNASMVYGLYDIRGDDSLKLAHYEERYAALAGGGHPSFFSPVRDWNHPLLDRLGVRWVMTGPREPPTKSEWRLAYDGRDSRVYERPSALSVVRWATPEPGGALEVVTREPGRWEIEWKSPRADRIIVAETWEEGWRAELDGRAVRLVAEEGLFLAVDVPRGSGTLLLKYRPPRWGMALALTLAGLSSTLLLARWESRTTLS